MAFGVRIAHALSKRQLEIAFALFLLAVSLRFLFSLLPLAEGAIGQSFTQRRRVIVEDTMNLSGASEFTALSRAENFRAIHSAPLMSSSGDVLGVLSVCFDHPRHPSERVMRLADICARKAAVFVERARAIEALQLADRRKDEFLATTCWTCRASPAACCSCANA